MTLPALSSVRLSGLLAWERPAAFANVHCAVFPLYYTGHQIQKGRTNSYVSVSDFMKYTTANLPRGSWRYWCAARPVRVGAIRLATIIIGLVLWMGA